MNKIITAKNLKKTYQVGETTVKALNDVTFDLFEGEFVVVLGPSGSGKSTLLNIIGGMDTPDSGEIHFKDKRIDKFNEKQLTGYRRTVIGFVFQFFNIMPSLTARENVMLAADLVRDSLDIDEIFKLVDLEDRAHHFPSQLSGGQQQRVSIARAIVKNPEILLCDEPTGALDFATGLSVLRLLKDFNEKYGKTVMIISHNTAIASMADRVFHMRDGMLTSVDVNENPLQPEEVVW